VAWGTTPSTMYYNPCRTGEIDNNIFDVASDVTVTIRLRSFDALDRFTETTSFYDWEVKQYYNFIPNGLISMTFTADALLHREASTVTAWMGVAITALVFSIWELALRLRALRKITILKARRAKERAALEKKMNESRPIADASVESRGGKSRKTGAGTDSTSADDQPTGRLRLRGEQCAKWKMDLRNSMGKSWTLWAIGVDVLTIVFLVDKLLSAQRDDIFDEIQPGMRLFSFHCLEPGRTQDDRHQLKRRRCERFRRFGRLRRTTRERPQQALSAYTTSQPIIQWSNHEVHAG
jgi:hypothetical protein